MPLSSIVSSCRLSNAISRILRPASSSVPRVVHIVCSRRSCARSRSPAAIAESIGGSRSAYQASHAASCSAVPTIAVDARGDEHEGEDAIGVLEREVDLVRAAHRAPDERRPLDSAVVEHGERDPARASTPCRAPAGSSGRTRGRRTGARGTDPRTTRTARPRSGSPIAPDGGTRRPGPGRPPRRTAAPPRSRRTSTAHPSPSSPFERRPELRVRLLEQLRQHAGLPDRPA